MKKYTVLLSRYARNLGMEECYTDREQYEAQHSHTYYSTKVTIKGHGEWSTPESYISSDHAREVAAKMAYEALTGPSPPLPAGTIPSPRQDDCGGAGGETQNSTYREWLLATIAIVL